MEKKVEAEPSSDQPQMTNRNKGGLITMPFIIANEAFEKVASYGLLPNMIMYLIKDYKLGVAKGTNILFLWSAATNFTPVVGAFIADSYTGRFLTIVFGCAASLLGMILLWLTAMIPEAKPLPCDNSTQSCKSATTGQMTLLLSSFALMSIGAGGIRSSSMAFGADQIDRKGEPNNQNQRILERYFSWYYASAAISVLIAFTGIVYIQDHLGWRAGFGVPAVLMLLSALLFILASPVYVKQRANNSLLTGFVQVFVAAYKNRKIQFPYQCSDHIMYHHRKNSTLVAPTNKLRFLNKACIIKDPERDIAPGGLAKDPWSLCTVEQVEEVKVLIRVIPLWSTGIVMYANISQNSFPLLQANSLDRHLTPTFEIPAGSFGMFSLVVLTAWIFLYDRVLLPLASKIRGRPVRIRAKDRMGIGLFFSCLSVIVAALVENVRRRKAIRDGYVNNPHAVLDMTAMWLLPQHILGGISEAFNAIGQTEFYYSEFPRTMSSIASSLFGLSMAVANLLASAIVSSVDGVTSRGGKDSWVSDNINKGHYDNYYWILAAMSGINLLYFVACSWVYGPTVDQGSTVSVSDENGSGERELTEVGRK